MLLNTQYDLFSWNIISTRDVIVLLVLFISFFKSLYSMWRQLLCRRSMRMMTVIRMIAIGIALSILSCSQCHCNHVSHARPPVRLQ